MLSILIAGNDAPQTTVLVTDPEVDFPNIYLNVGPSISQLSSENFSLNDPGIYQITINVPLATGVGTVAIVVDGVTLATGISTAPASIVATAIVPPGLPPSLVQIIGITALDLAENATIVIERLA
ncbi:hypothetical protein ACWF7H_03015 [Peribacillus butanolivorans]|uniref:hypothetical protein n=1 Tax=Peribacillus butanolivorans TaxID=421767 RepID=UPI003697575C